LTKEKERFPFRFWVTADKQELIKFLKSKSDTEEGFSEWARNMFDLIRVNKLDPSTLEDMRKQKMKIDIDFKSVMTEIKKIELIWMKESEKTPSYAAKKAIQTRVSNKMYGEGGVLPTQEEEKEKEKEIPELDKGKIRSWVESHYGKYIMKRQHLEKGWSIHCDFPTPEQNNLTKKCGDGIVQLPTQEEADKKLIEHLINSHSEKIWEEMLQVV